MWYGFKISNDFFRRLRISRNKAKQNIINVNSKDLPKNEKNIDSDLEMQKTSSPRENPYLYDVSGPKKVKDHSKSEQQEDYNFEGYEADLTYSIIPKEKFSLVNPS